MGQVTSHLVKKNTNTFRFRQDERMICTCGFVHAQSMDRVMASYERVYAAADVYTAALGRSVVTARSLRSDLA